MAITITEQITRNLHVEFGAEHIHALVTDDIPNGPRPTVMPCIPDVRAGRVTHDHDY